MKGGGGRDDGGADGRRLAVIVPDDMRPAFERAQRYVEDFFAARVEDPVRGVIEVAGDRYIFVRAASMSTEFFQLIARLYRDRGEAEARSVASSFLFDMAHAIGKADARTFHERMGVTDPIEKLSAGPIHFAFSGWALVDIHPESRPAPDDSYFLVYDHPYSFEADSWIRGGQRSDLPVCTMNAGYSSGWCEESFGVPLVAVEFQCRAAGDPHCRFVMATPERIQDRLAEVAPELSARSERAPIEVPEFFKRKRLEEELHRHRDHLEEMVTARTGELTEAYEKLRREMQQRERAEAKLAQAAKMEAIGHLAGGLAHDFNNLLTTVLAGVQMAIRHSGGNERAGEWLKHALAATERAADLTRHMLALSRDYDPRMTPVDIGELVVATARFLGSSMPENIEIATEGCEPGTVVSANETELEHALLNLALNARDAMAAGGTLTFHVELVDVDEAEVALDPAARPGRFVRISVTDTGIGMEPELLDRIFEPLFTTKQEGTGTGFGLSRVYACVRAHGGWVSAESEVDRGSVFRLYLPHLEATVRPSPGAPGELPRGTETVLLVDDTEAVLFAGKRVLEAYGYTVLVARDGDEAIAVVERADAGIDLVITDLVMPNVDGRAVLAALRDAGLVVPVILTSGHALDRSADEIVAEGFAAFVAKPFDAEQLTTSVRDALDAAQ